MAHFRTKARAVDLLGKGQIADLPTAITELWKNGYDAYGDNLEAHLYFSEYKDVNNPFFVISDDGKGMSQKDILDKWIVLGTDSKVRRRVPQKGPETLGKEPRLPTGEKGIGRLSVAYLGSQMLMLTKKRGHHLQALYFDWRILDNYNLFVEDINLPLQTINSVNDFETVFLDLIENFKKNIPGKDSEEYEKWVEHEDLIDELIAGTESIDLPSFFENEIVSPLIEKNVSHGTKFVILNPVEQLELLKNFSKSEDEEKEIVDFVFSCLSGLSNVFKTKREDTPFNTKFFVYDDEIPKEVISTRDFFDPEDFDNCDHVIQGKFDKEGNFVGEINMGLMKFRV